jgi:hypothetical protein
VRLHMWLFKLAWCQAGEVLKRTCRRVKTKTGEISEQVTYGITSLGWEQADAEQLEHWNSCGEGTGPLRTEHITFGTSVWGRIKTRCTSVMRHRCLQLCVTVC